MAEGDFSRPPQQGLGKRIREWIDSDRNPLPPRGQATALPSEVEPLGLTLREKRPLIPAGPKEEPTRTTTEPQETKPEPYDWVKETDSGVNSADLGKVGSKLDDVVSKK